MENPRHRSESRPRSSSRPAAIIRPHARHHQDEVVASIRRNRKVGHPNLTEARQIVDVTNPVRHEPCDPCSNTMVARNPRCATPSCRRHTASRTARPAVRIGNDSSGERAAATALDITFKVELTTGVPASYEWRRTLSWRSEILHLLLERTSSLRDRIDMYSGLAASTACHRPSEYLSSYRRPNDRHAPAGRVSTRWAASALTRRIFCFVFRAYGNLPPAKPPPKSR